MRLSLERLPADGRVVQVTGADWAREAAALALGDPQATVRGEVRVRGGRKRAEVDVSLESTGQLTCIRCAEPVPVELSTDVTLIYLPAESAGTHPEVELKSEELDVGFFEGEQLDLSAVVSEALALALPERIVCADVSACDARVEALMGPVDAPSESVNSGFAALAGLKIS